MSDLLPCPFCGDAYDKGEMQMFAPQTSAKWTKVTCRVCGASAPTTVWNRRAAVSGERVREALDAARWQRFCELWAASTELSATQDESGFWIIRQIEAVENETFGALVGETPDDAIDKALPLAAQPEGK